jgi:hypothetical protein
MTTFTNYDYNLFAAADKAQGREYDKTGVVDALHDRVDAFVSKVMGVDEEELPTFSDEARSLTAAIKHEEELLDCEEEAQEVEALKGLVEDLSEWV